MACLLYACESKNSEVVSATNVADDSKQQYFTVPVKYYKQNSSELFAIDDFHNDSANAVVAYSAMTDSPIQSQFFTGYRFYGYPMGGRNVFTVLPGFGEIYFKMSDVHRK